MNTPVTNHPSLLNLSDQSVHVLEQTTIIGRHEDCNMVLKSERGASRKHARITIENNAAVLMDLGSLNGTMVNGREIARAVQLSDGDLVVFDEQEYRYVSPALAAQHSGDNVTVIANKDEIGRPESIKPAIRVVDTPNVSPQTPQQAQAQQTDQVHQQQPDQIQPSDHFQQPDLPGTNDYVSSFDDTEAWEIPATSRPGGDAITPKRLQEKYSSTTRSRPVWMRWLVIAPMIILFMLVVFYLAYTAGFSAGTSGSPTGSS